MNVYHNVCMYVTNITHPGQIPSMYHWQGTSDLAKPSQDAAGLHSSSDVYVTDTAQSRARARIIYQDT